MSMDIEEEYDRIFRFCYWKVHDKEIAEDLTQETFLRFLDSNYDEQGKRIRYLYTIARNLCIDESRKPVPAEIPEEIPDTGAENNFAAKVFLKQVLQQLPEEDLELVIMRYVNMESTENICAVLKISRFSLYRKLRKIQKTLDRLTGMV
ncbi:MAG: sigma-70 family RNA polymerase sigma factor [Anaerolineaceae bacterium]|nr:sigma-70 family RNA polymerase sigma factor [Anaerolineaceae bacterium]